MLDSNWSNNQQQRYVSPASAASFAPEYHQRNAATNPQANPLSRARDSYVQGARRSATNPAWIALNTRNGVQRQQPGVKKESSLKNEERVPVKYKLGSKVTCKINANAPALIG